MLNRFRGMASTAAPGANTRHFRIDGAQMLDPSGQPFMPRGFNVRCGLLPYSNWRTPGVMDDETLTQRWGANFIRLNLVHNGDGFLITDPETGKLVFDRATHGGNSDIFLPRDWPGNYPIWEDVYDLIDKYTAQHIPVMVNFQGTSYPADPTLAEQAANTKWLAAVAKKYIDNPYVWFETYNERGEQNGIPIEDWLHYNRIAIQAIRATGNNAPIFVSAQNYGQDAHLFEWGLNPAKSSFLTYGPALIEEFENIGFDLHLYGRYGNVPASQIGDYFNAVRDAGLYVFVGEFGGHPTADRDNNWLNFQATERLIEAVPDFPGAYWAETQGSPLTDTEYGNAVLTTYDTDGAPTNLTETGWMIWSWLHQIPYVSRAPQVRNVQTFLNADGTKLVNFDVSEPGGTAYVVVQGGARFPPKISEIQQKNTAPSIALHAAADTAVAGGNVSISFPANAPITAAGSHACVAHVVPRAADHMPGWSQTASQVRPVPWVDRPAPILIDFGTGTAPTGVNRWTTTDLTVGNATDYPLVDASGATTGVTARLSVPRNAGDNSGITSGVVPGVTDSAIGVARDDLMGSVYYSLWKGGQSTTISLTGLPAGATVRVTAAGLRNRTTTYRTRLTVTGTSSDVVSWLSSGAAWITPVSATGVVRPDGTLDVAFRQLNADWMAVGAMMFEVQQ